MNATKVVFVVIGAGVGGCAGAMLGAYINRKIEEKNLLLEKLEDVKDYDASDELEKETADMKNIRNAWEKSLKNGNKHYADPLVWTPEEVTRIKSNYSPDAIRRVVTRDEFVTAEGYTYSTIVYNIEEDAFFDSITHARLQLPEGTTIFNKDDFDDDDSVFFLDDETRTAYEVVLDEIDQSEDDTSPWVEDPPKTTRRKTKAKTPAKRKPRNPDDEED